jgi:anti-anti-sigma factor
MMLFLYRVRDLQILELVPRDGGRFEEKRYTPRSHHEPSDVVALALHGDLFFGLAHELRNQLNEIVRVQKPKYIIVRTRRAHSIDYSCWQALFDFAQAFSQNGGKLYLTGLRQELCEVINAAGMNAYLPPEQQVLQSESAWRAFEEGLERIAAQLPPEPQLPPAWAHYMSALRQRQSVSHFRDPLNDPATLGAMPE